MTGITGVISLIPALDSEFLSVVTLPVAKQPTDDSMLLSGRNLRQVTYNIGYLYQTLFECDYASKGSPDKDGHS